MFLNRTSNSFTILLQLWITKCSFHKTWKLTKHLENDNLLRTYLLCWSITCLDLCPPLPTLRQQSRPVFSCIFRANKVDNIFPTRKLHPNKNWPCQLLVSFSLSQWLLFRRLFVGLGWHTILHTVPRQLLISPGSPKPIFKIVVPTTTIFEHTPFFPKSGFYHSRTDLATSFFLPLGKLRFFLPLTAFSKAHLRRCLQQPTPYSQNKLESAVASGNTTSHTDFTDFTDHLWIYLGNPRNKSRLTTNSRIPVPSLCFSVFNYHHKKKRGKTSKVAVFGEIVFHAKKRSFT